MLNSLKTVAVLGLLVMLGGGPAFGEPAAAVAGSPRASLMKANIYLVAGDYRRALEACQKEIDNAPSVEAYIHVTYVFHAIDAYLDHLSKEERWMATRLNKSEADRLWQQQTQWRTAHPQTWWTGMPDAWR